MSEETTPPKQDEGATAPAPEAAPPETITLSQSRLNEIIEERLQRDRRVRSQAPAVSPPAPAAVPEEMTPRQMREAFAQMQAQMQFRDLADELGVPRELRGDLFDLSQVQKPTDLRMWMETKTKSYGGKGNPPVSQTPPPP